MPLYTVTQSMPCPPHVAWDTMRRTPTCAQTHPDALPSPRAPRVLLVFPFSTALQGGCVSEDWKSLPASVDRPFPQMENRPQPWLSADAVASVSPRRLRGACGHLLGFPWRTYIISLAVANFCFCFSFQKFNYDLTWL